MPKNFKFQLTNGRKDSDTIERYSREVLSSTAFSFSDVRMDSLFLPVKSFEHNPRLRAL